MRLIKGAAAGLATLIAMGALTACTDDAPEPSPTPTATSSPTATPTPTPTTPPEAIAPERPAAMDQISVGGAEAAAKYFLALYPHVYYTQDLTEWRALSLPECVFCTSVVTSVEEEAAAGHRSSGGLVTFLETFEAVELTANLYRVVLLVDQEAGVEYGPDGAVVEEAPGARYVMSVGLVPSESGWMVSAVAVDEAPET